MPRHKHKTKSKTKTKSKSKTKTKSKNKIKRGSNKCSGNKRSKSITKRKSSRRKRDGMEKGNLKEVDLIMKDTRGERKEGERKEGEGEGKMVPLNEDGEWEECPICMEPTNFDNVTSQYWVCCGQKMCIKCDDDLSKNKGERRNCPFCRTPPISSKEPKHLSQLLMFAKKGKAWAQCSLGDRYRVGEYVEKDIEKAIYYYE